MIEHATAISPYTILDECGDFALFEECQDSVLAAIGDVGGHGSKNIGYTAQACKEILILNKEQPLPQIFQMLHQFEKLNLYGLTLFLAKFYRHTPLLDYISVGNINANILRNHTVRSLNSQDGIVGYQIPTNIKEHAIKLVDGDLILITSDGVGSNRAAIENIKSEEDIKCISNRILQTCKKTSDDALCCVIRFQLTEIPEQKSHPIQASNYDVLEPFYSQEGSTFELPHKKNIKGKANKKAVLNKNPTAKSRPKYKLLPEKYMLISIQNTAHLESSLTKLLGLFPLLNSVQFKIEAVLLELSGIGNREFNFYLKDKQLQIKTETPPRSVTSVADIFENCFVIEEGGNQFIVIQFQTLRPINTDKLLDTELREIIGLGIDNNAYEAIKRQRNQDKLVKEKEVAELANQSKSKFLAAMSHEIRTPMNGVIGTLDLLSQSSLSNDQRDLISVAKNSANSLLTIINDILDFSKIEAGKMALDSEVFNWHSLLDEVTELLKCQINAKQLRCYCFIAPELIQNQTGDPVRIRQVLFNLMGNAIKFTHTSDQKEGIIIARVSVEETQKTKSIFVNIKDNGIGINREKHKLLFHPFVQADDGNNRNYDGTGLGLSISSKLVKLMGGDIGFNSDEGEGAEFYFKLPFNPDKSQPNQVKPLKGLTTLYVNGNSLYDRYLAEMLAEQGARCISTNLSATIAEVCSHNNVDVVIVNVEHFACLRRYITKHMNEPSLNLLKYVLLDENDNKDIAPKGGVTINVNPFQVGKIITQISTLCHREPFGNKAVEVIPVDSVSVPTIEDAENAGTLILIVEDNISNQIVLKKQLNLFGFQSVVAGNGQKALKMLRKYKIALVLCDCQMPEMDGYEFTEAVRTQEAKTDIRLTIIAVTANAITGEKQKCLDAGMDDYISKPVELKKLAQLLNHWLPTDTLFEAKELKTTSSSESELAVNIRYLESIIGNNRDNQIKIMRKFLHSIDENSRDLEECMVKKRTEEIKAIAHKLKSSSKAVGAIRLSEYLQALEDVAMTNAEETIDELYSKIKREFAVVTMFVKQQWEL